MWQAHTEKIKLTLHVWAGSYVISRSLPKRGNNIPLKMYRSSEVWKNIHCMFDKAVNSKHSDVNKAWKPASIDYNGKEEKWVVENMFEKPQMLVSVRIAFNYIQQSLQIGLNQTGFFFLLHKMFRNRKSRSSIVALRWPRPLVFLQSTIFSLSDVYLLLRGCRFFASSLALYFRKG